jgi:hypothetical protein
MSLTDHVFLYCERGTNEVLLAEPVNAASNAGFLLAALIGLILVLRRPREQRSSDHFLLIALVLLIGLGSLAFHLLASRATELADVVPIGVFMLVYLGFALNRFLRVPPGWTVLIVIGFAAMAFIILQLKCWDGVVGVPGAEVTDAKECLNGSVGYLPALFALIVVGGLLRERGHRAASYILWAAAIFAVSVTFRSLDLSLCDRVIYDGRKIGTHFIWHLLNALTLFLLLRASLEARGDCEGKAEVRPTQLRAPKEEGLPEDQASEPEEEAPKPEEQALDAEEPDLEPGDAPKPEEQASKPEESQRPEEPKATFPS